jgi:hypothetical protein
LCIAICLAGVAHAASLLIFDDLGASQITIPDTYGDRLAGTPNIDMSYVNVGYTPQNFGGVVGVAFGISPGRAQIIFTPDPGYGVHLIGFDVGYYQGTVLNELDLLDGGGIMLENLDSRTPFYTGASATYTPDYYQPGVLQLNFDSYEYFGIDNLQFDQYPLTGAAVPEPSTLGIMGLGLGLGLAGLACLRKRRPDGGKAMRGQAPSRV